MPPLPLSPPPPSSPPLPPLAPCVDAVIPCDAIRGCDYVTVVAFSPDGRTLAVGDEHHVVRLFGVADGPSTAPVLKQTLAPPSDDYILSLAWSPDGQFLAVGDDDFYLTVYRRGGSADWSTAAEQVVHENPACSCMQ